MHPPASPSTLSETMHYNIANYHLLKEKRNVMLVPNLFLTNIMRNMILDLI